MLHLYVYMYTCNNYCFDSHNVLMYNVQKFSLKICFYKKHYFEINKH